MTRGKLAPKLITFDGEARSGKGTVVQACKDYLRDEGNYKVMLIDAGQVFRSLVVMAKRSGVDPDSPDAIDTFLSGDNSVESCVKFVKSVYNMKKEERDALLYTNEVGRDSAKFGARPLCQEFKDNLLKKWLKDAGDEGFDIVLLDGRALEEVGLMLEREGLCEFIIGLYFVCDPVVGARRTLGYHAKSYDQLDGSEREAVDKLVMEINARNTSDRERDVHPILPPKNSIEIILPEIPAFKVTSSPVFFIVNTSAEMKKHDMQQPIAQVVNFVLDN